MIENADWQEVGPYAAMVCFAELLQPSLRNIYEEMGKESKKQQETLAQLKRAELDMAPEDMDKDAWCVLIAPDTPRASILNSFLF